MTQADLAPLPLRRQGRACRVIALPRVQAGRLPLLLSLLLPLLPLGVGSLSAEPADAPLRRADQVVVRGTQDLAGALTRAAGEALAAPGRTVALILDVTENTARAAQPLRAALSALASASDAAGAGAGWRIARLGDPLGPRLPSPAHLAPLIAPLLAQPTPALSSVAALRATLAGLRAPGAAIVYLADWRFEDDEHLEALVSLLVKSGSTFSVVGSEAAFSRAWNDGWRGEQERFQGLAAGKDEPYEPGIGRDPYGPDDPAEPWHGGDTAHPGRPYRWRPFLWASEFSPSDLERPGADDGSGSALEELKRRLPSAGLPGAGLPGAGLPGAAPGAVGGLGGAAPADLLRRVPLPSSFGPYGLMRACAATGGRYVLWSWNPGGRAGVTYDYARCNAFAPDLRARDALRAGLAHDPCAAACVEAWHLLLDVDGDLLEHTPPLTRGLGPQPLEVAKEREAFRRAWRQKSERDGFVKAAGEALAALTKAEQALARGLVRAGEAQPRHAADARLFLHIAQVAHFEVAEAQAAARQVPDSEFAGAGAGLVTLVPERWILPGRDPEAVRTSDAVPFDPAAGAQLRAARAEHLRRFLGTPFGEEVALNPVNTWRARRVELPQQPGTPWDAGRSPGESKGPPKAATPPSAPPGTPAPRPGGGSSGGGPSTGR